MTSKKTGRFRFPADLGGLANHRPADRMATRSCSTGPGAGSSTSTYWPHGATDEAPREVYVAPGRRSGKSRFGAFAPGLAAAEYPQRRGETAIVAHIAPDKRQPGDLTDARDR